MSSVMHGLFSKANLRSALLHYLSGLSLYGLAVAFYHWNRYYAGFLDPSVKGILLYAFIAYAAIMPFVFLFPGSRNIEGHKPAIVFRVLWRTSADFLRYLERFTKEPGYRMRGVSASERTALLFMVVKLFFLPLMLNFMVSHLRAFIGFIPQLPGLRLSIDSLSSAGYAVALATIFLIDTAFFSFGYLFEAGFLRNKVRSVEPTFLGWSVALLCYPPFNSLLEKYAAWWPSDYAQFPTMEVTFAARLAVVAFMLVYVWATVSLGTKCSNLTNRGIVTTGAYRLVRHPAYVSKNLAWWVTLLPIMSLPVFASMSVWTFVYFLRAVTEERHLIADPDYQSYCRQTRYRFVPFVY
ncbi:DUF1295 domain-containing protein [Candidatus Woesearchaeota archaeon]|nr:DUF1295 domain-containing protein [Candidatus Woesearchaeota archaeon]